MDAVFLKNQSFEGWSTENVMEYPYKKSDLVYICISTTARAISQIPIRVGKQTGEEDELKFLPLKDPWQRKFEKPNFLMDRYSFTEAIVGYLMHDGDIFILPFPPGSPEPISLWVIRKKFIGPIKDRNTGQLVGWNYNPKGVIYDSFGGSLITENTIPISIEEMCHIYFWNPYDPYMGMAPSEAGRLNILSDYKAGMYTANFFDEGAQPGGMLETDRSLTDKQFNRILNQFETRHQGYKKGHRFAILENGLKYTQAGLSQKDMEFPKLRDMSARRIYQIYGMKEAIISETKTVNRSTSIEERKEWWESTNLPIMRMICSALNHTLFRDTDLRCQFDYTKIEALRQAMEDKVNTGYKLWQMGATFNQVNQRLNLGFKKNKWGDTWYMPVNLMPVEDYSSAPPASPSNLPVPIEEPPKEVDYVDIKALPLKSENLGESRNEAIWNGMIRQVAPFEDAFARKTSRVFYNMRKRTLDLLYRKKTVEEVQKDLDDVDKELYSEEFAEIRKVAAPLFRQALELGVILMTSETGIEVAFDLTDPESILFLTSKELKIQGIVQTVKEQIRRELLIGYKEGESIDQIAARIRGVFNMADSRARMIARTEVIGAANEGRYLAINRSGFQKQQWFTALDERVRLQHRAMHGKTIKVGELWTMPDGSVLRHPGDHEGPPHQVIMCRCIAVAYIED